MTSNPDPDRYLVAQDGPQVEVKIKGSRFFGQSFAVTSRAAFDEILSAIRKRDYDATHHCSAYRLGPPDAAEEKSDDDGEPNGTAGSPILGAIHRADLVDAGVVVVRYYGGTKLGMGGLVRAYGDTARQALDAAGHAVRWLTVQATVGCSFEDSGTVETILGKNTEALLSVDRNYDPDPTFALSIKRRRADDLHRILVEATAGRIRWSA